jgi:hypothetical protein
MPDHLGVVNEAIVRAVCGTDPVIVVDSPPGAGKTFLVENAAVFAAAERGMRVGVVTPGVPQAYDVVDRMLAYDLPRLELVHAESRSLPQYLSGRIVASQGWNPNLNQGPGVLVANVHIPAAHIERLPPASFDLLIVDEAYQLASSQFLQVADLAERVLLVGDPGQLPPVISADTANLEAAKHKMHWPAPRYVLDRWPMTPVYGLPATRRLLPDTARLVQSAFYPELPFESIAMPADRRLVFDVAGVDPAIDPALDAVAAGASLVAIVLPGAPPAHEDADGEVSAMIARVAQRLLVRRARWAGRHLTGADIGCIDSNRIPVGSIAGHLRAAGMPEVSVDTVERWQGLQRPFTVVRHPLSRVGEPQAFDLEAGRWCVALSRHLLGCLIVCRESVAQVVDEYRHTCDTAAAGARDSVWAGYTAHRAIWSELGRQGRLFRV